MMKKWNKEPGFQCYKNREVRDAPLINDIIRPGGKNREKRR
jgi:hypothetical protein